MMDRYYLIQAIRNIREELASPAPARLHFARDWHAAAWCRWRNLRRAGVPAADLPAIPGVPLWDGLDAPLEGQPEWAV